MGVVSYLDQLLKASVAPGPYMDGYGITIRQLYAGLAMQGIRATMTNGHANYEQVARMAIDQADYLLQEFAKERP